MAGDVARGLDQDAPAAAAAAVEPVDSDQRPRVEPRRVGIVDEGGDDDARRRVARSRARAADASSPWSARCMAAPPSNANATSATPIRSGDGRSHHATSDAEDADHERSDCGPAAGGLAREDADDDRAEDGQRPVRQRTVQRLTR